MLLIPAIDLKDGQCVRLRQGRMEDDTVFSSDPLAVAKRWADEGARRLHLVDLDGAFAGEPRNAAIVRQITAELPGLPVQIGGGIRTVETAAAYVEAGISWVIIGTKAVSHPAFVKTLCEEFPGKVIVGLDAKNGEVATDRWASSSGVNVTELAQHFEGIGVSAIVYTDISRDGMMQGVNAEATEALANAISIPVIASGGVTNIDDITALCQREASGIEGAIIGRALYEGTIDLASAQRQADTFAN